MRILLDENLDRRLKKMFDKELEVLTVTKRGWSGKKNGELLRLAEKEFDVFVTMDRNLEYQQNLRGFDLGILLIIAKSNRRSDVESAMVKVNSLLGKIRLGGLHIVSA